MTENGDDAIVNKENKTIDNERLNPEDETLYVQTSDEYDRIFSRIQMSVVDGVDLGSTCSRIVGPSGCGKTTLARSLAFDLKIADKLINEHGLPVWEMPMDEIALFHNIVMNDDTEDEDYCPNCDTQSFYERKRKNPTYRCNNCGEEFDEPRTEEVSDDHYERFDNVESVEEELEDRGLVTMGGEPADNYPHSRAEAYRDIYRVYEEGEIVSCPYFEVTMSHAKYAKDLIGHPHIGDNGTTFVKGKVTNAVEASNKEPTILTLDEINRAPTSAKDELYDALDGRVKVSMDEVGGVDIEGTPENLHVISTMNKGSGHHVEPLDFAEKRRLSSTYYVDFLGTEYPEKEIELISEKTPVPHKLASEMVSTANDIRQTAENNNSDLSYGLPTGTLLEWGREAYTNYLAGIEQPVVNAGVNSVAKAIYDHDESEITEVESIISKNLRGVEFFDDDGDDEINGNSGSSGGEARFVCKDETDVGCSWSAFESEVPSQSQEWLVCPECDGAIVEKKPGE